MGVLTWIVPSGQYDRVMNDSLGKNVPVPGTYKIVETNPQGIQDILMAPIKGFYDPDSGSANTIDVALFVLIIGGFLGVVNLTGSINTGIARAMTKMKGQEIWMIPIWYDFAFNHSWFRLVNLYWICYVVCKEST